MIVLGLWFFAKNMQGDDWASHMLLVGKNPPAGVGDAGDPGLIPELGRSPGEGNGNPFQDYCLENPMDRGTW